MKFLILNLKTKKGFTLLELLLVIAIIASLAGIILMALNPAQRLEEANEVKSLSNAKDIEKALNAYVVEHNGQYPTELQTYFNQGATTVSICKEGEDCVGAELTELISGEYINNMPVNTGYDTTEKSGYDVILGEGGISIGGVYGTPTFLLRDDFTTADAAPLISPRTSEPGPGIWDIIDTGNNLNISNGLLLLQGNSVGDPGIWSSVSIQRTSGLANFTSVNASSWGIFYSAGFDVNTSGAISETLRFSTDITYYTGGIIIPFGYTSLSNTTYNTVNVLRNNGGMIFIKGGQFSSWTLMYVDNLQTTSPLYPSIAQNSVTLNANIDSLRTLQLPAPFNDDYGLATQRLAGARTVGDTFTHEPNFVMEWTQTTVPASGITLVRFRKQDSNNTWQVQVNLAGNFYLQEVVAGVATTRGSAAAVVSNGYRIVVVADENTIRGYSNNVLRWTYSSATNFQTFTSGQINTLDGAISDLVIWPRTLSGSAAAALDKAIE